MKNVKPLNITECANGYTLCFNQPKDLTYCYPNDLCPTGDTAPIWWCGINQQQQMETIPAVRSVILSARKQQAQMDFAHHQL